MIYRMGGLHHLVNDDSEAKAGQMYFDKIIPLLPDLSTFVPSTLVHEFAKNSGNNKQEVLKVRGILESLLKVFATETEPDSDTWMLNGEGKKVKELGSLEKYRASLEEGAQS